MFRNQLTATVFFFILSIVFAGFAQEIEPPVVEDEPETPAEFRYYVPFPESTFRGDWRFRLEMGVTLPVAYRLTLLGYDSQGQKVLEERTEALSRWTVFSWENAEEIIVNRIQSLVVVADAPLHGVLWLWNDLLGIVNGVGVTELKGERLVLPHVPSDFFTWRTSFAVHGISTSSPAGNGDIVFGYNNGATRSQVNALSGLRNNGYFTGSPFYNILISDVPNISWGSVRATSTDFEIAGFQTFQTMDGRFQSGAVELAGNGVPHGFFGFSSGEEQGFREWFAFTNPNDVEVSVAFTLSYLVPAGEDEEIKIGTASETMILTPFERKNIILGLNLFAQNQGPYLNLSYSVVPADEETEPLPIYGTHLQSDMDRTALGAHSQVPELTNHTATWFNFDETLFDQTLELYNPGEELVSLNLSLSDNLGEPLIERVVEIKPGDRVVVQSRDFKDILIADFEGLKFDQPYRIDLLSPEGFFFAKLTATRDGDFAIINPFSEILPLEPEVEPEPQGE